MGQSSDPLSAMAMRTGVELIGIKALNTSRTPRPHHAKRHARQLLMTANRVSGAINVTNLFDSAVNKAVSTEARHNADLNHFQPDPNQHSQDWG